MALEDPELPLQLRRGASRNQSCPCGSGQKLKRCCLPFVELITEPNHGVEVAMWLDSPSLYVTPENALAVDEGDPWLTVHNLAAVAVALEELGAIDASLRAYRQMREILQSQPENRNMASMVEEDVVTLALNHPELAREGLAALDWLKVHGFEEDPAVRVSHQLNRAEFLTYLGQEAEARAIYHYLLEQIRQGGFDRELIQLIRARYDEWQREILPLRGIAPSPKDASKT